MGLSNRIQHAWNAFLNKDPTTNGGYYSYGSGSSNRPDRQRFTRGNERSIVSSIYNRIAIDSSSIKIQHVRLDSNDRFLEVINSGLNSCLTVEANLDQTGRAFIQDAVTSMLDEGCIAIIPVDTDENPDETGSWDVLSWRVGKVIQWYPSEVKVSVYNERTGLKEDLVVSKKNACIVESPLYSVINEPNSTLQRLKNKLNILDAIDNESGSGKFNLLIHFPHIIKTKARQDQAVARREELENQLGNSKYGVAYTDGSERVTQLNRPIENNLMQQIEYLTSELYSQLGITKSIMDGTADEKTMLNYYNRTIEPLLSAIIDEMIRKFLTKSARTQKQSILMFRDIFKLVPIGDIAEISDKLTRNEIVSSNEVRQMIAMKPSLDPKADELRNSNIKKPTSDLSPVKEEEEIQNGQI